MYLGPETIVPLASLLAAIGGFLLMFWRKTVAFFRSVVRGIGRGFSKILGKSTS